MKKSMSLTEVVATTEQDFKRKLVPKGDIPETDSKNGFNLYKAQPHRPDLDQVQRVTKYGGYPVGKKPIKREDPLFLAQTPQKRFAWLKSFFETHSPAPSKNTQWWKDNAKKST